MLELKNAEAVRNPVSRTNVILKDTNFRECFNLWTFLDLYNSRGYDSVVEKHSGAMPESAKSSIYDIFPILNFIFRVNLSEKTKNKLEDTYQQENEQLRLEEIERKKREEEEVLKRIETAVSEKTAEYELHIQTLTNEFNKAKIELNEKWEAETKRLKTAHIGEIAKLNKDKENEIKGLVSDYNKQLFDARTAHQSELADLHSSYTAQLNRVTTGHAQALEALTAKYSAETASLKEILAGCDEKRTEEIDRINKIHKNEKDAVINSYEITIAALKQSCEEKLKNKDIDCASSIADQKAAAGRTLELKTAYYKDLMSKQQQESGRQLENAKKAFLKQLEKDSSRSEKAIKSLQKQLEASRLSHKKELEKIRCKYEEELSLYKNADNLSKRELLKRLFK